MTAEERAAQAALTVQVAASSYEAVGASIGVSGASVWKFVTQDQPPQKWEVRQKYGLSVEIPTPPCKTCGKVHTKAHPQGKRNLQYNVNLNADPDLYAALEAARGGRPKAEIVREALTMWLEATQTDLE